VGSSTILRPIQRWQRPPATRRVVPATEPCARGSFGEAIRSHLPQRAAQALTPRIDDCERLHVPPRHDRRRGIGQLAVCHAVTEDLPRVTQRLLKLRCGGRKSRAAMRTCLCCRGRPPGAGARRGLPPDARLTQTPPCPTGTSSRKSISWPVVAPSRQHAAAHCDARCSTCLEQGARLISHRSTESHGTRSAAQHRGAMQQRSMTCCAMTDGGHECICKLQWATAHQRQPEGSAPSPAATVRSSTCCRTVSYRFRSTARCQARRSGRPNQPVRIIVRLVRRKSTRRVKVTQGTAAVQYSTPRVAALRPSTCSHQG
jgi:hypothetical protein